MALTKVSNSMQDSAPVSVKDFGAVGDGVTDDTAAIQAAIDALTAGGSVLFPAGEYLISSSLNVSVYGVTFKGQGSAAVWNGVTTVYTGGSIITKAAAMTNDAIVINGGKCVLDSIAVIGKVGNTGDGIYIRNAQSCVLMNVNVASIGGVGIRIGNKDTANSNCNAWQLTNVTSQYNGSHGIEIYDQSASGGPNANAGTAVGLNVAGNGGDGVRIENGLYNTFVGLLSQQNTGYGVKLVGAPGLSLYAVFNGGDIEANTGGQWSISGNVLHVTFIGPSTFVPSSVTPGNFQVIFSDGESSFRSFNVGASGSSISTIKHQQSFTPTIYGLSTAGTNTYVWQQGYYSIVGKVVTYYGVVRLSAKDAAMAGNIAIGLGSLAASWNTTLNRAICQINAENTTLGAGYGNFYGRIDENTNYIQLFKNNTTAGSNATVTASDISATSIIYFSGSYQLA